MKKILRISKTELEIMFFSPIAWLVLIVFAFQVGICFSDLYTNALRYQSIGYPVHNATSEMIGGIRGLFVQMLNYLYLYIPLITMGLMSREFNTGSIKLLYSSPVSNIQIILGKYLSVIIYGLCLILILVLPAFFVEQYVIHPDTMMIFVAILGVFLTICAYAAIGLFMSTLTRYQVVAVISTLIVLAILNYIGNVGKDFPLLRDITYWLSISGRSKVFLMGLICTKELVYFIIIIFMFLSFSVLKLRGERLKLSTVKNITSYAIILVIVYLFGYISIQPKFIKYYDSTSVKYNTLTPYSQNILKRINDGLTITTYVNLLDESWSDANPRNINYDLKRLEKYIRFRPDIKRNYVYYYGHTNNPHLDYYGDKTPREIMIDKCKWSRTDTNTFLPEKEVFKIDDISKEEGRLTRVIKRGNGKKVILRKYKDSHRWPNETNITAALKTLVDKSPIIAFSTGHGERSCTDYGEKGLGAITTLKTARYSLINQGFTVKDIAFSKPVPTDVDVVIIADVKKHFSNIEMKNYNSYIARGGNMIILGESKRQKFMNPLLKNFGLKFNEGVVVHPTKIYKPRLIVPDITSIAGQLSPSFISLFRRGYRFTMFNACSISIQDTVKDFNVFPLMITKDKGSWTDFNTKDFIDNTPIIDNYEIEESNMMMTFVNRKINGKEQRIFISGDSDCFTTSEISANRVNITSANFNVFSELMYSLTYGEWPININRIYSPDNKYTASLSVIPWMKFLYIWFIPLFLILLCMYILISRKRR